MNCDCGAPVFEVVSCNECYTEHLEINDTRLKIYQPAVKPLDEFSLLDEESEENELHDNASNPSVLSPVSSSNSRIRQDSIVSPKFTPPPGGDQNSLL